MEETTTRFESTTIQTEATTEAELTTEPSTENSYIINPNYKTYMNSLFSFQVPKSWSYDGSYRYYQTICINFSNGDSDFTLQYFDARQLFKDTSLSDEDCFNKRVDMLWEEKTCANVDIYQLDEIKYAKSSYSDSDFGIYFFVKNGMGYQINTTNISYIPNGEEIIEDLIASFEFDSNKFNLSFTTQEKLMKSDDKQFLFESLSFIQPWFENDKTVIINKCGKSIINGKRANIYDVSYISKDNEDTNKVYIYYPDDNSNVVSDKSCEELLTDNNDILNAELINQVLQDYLKQI